MNTRNNQSDNMDTWQLLAVVGICGLIVGWVLHSLFIRSYLRKHVRDHPLYPMYAEILEGDNKKEKKKDESPLNRK